MEWYDEIFKLIDMRSFSNLWYWLAIAVVWSSASHWVLGVPYDMIWRARRHGGQAQTDLEIIVQVNCNRILHIMRVFGLWIFGFVAFVLTMLGILGFYYWIEFAQAVFLLSFPMCFVGILSLSTARRIVRDATIGDALRKRLAWHRVFVQVIGMVAILVTSMFGMYHNITNFTPGG